jgi:hypothetical protein
MNDNVKTTISDIKAEIAEWPKEHRASLMNGLLQGLALGITAAEQRGCNITEIKEIEEFCAFVDANTTRVKKRNEALQKPKTVRDQLVDDIKELLRRAIAGRLRISKPKFEESLDAEDLINRTLLIVIAIGNRSLLDDAIQDIRIVRSIIGGAVDRETVKAEVESCNENFPTEVAAITRFNEMDIRLNGIGEPAFKPKDIWSNLRANVRVNFGYDDEGLETIDSRYR